MTKRFRDESHICVVFIVDDDTWIRVGRFRQARISVIREYRARIRVGTLHPAPDIAMPLCG